MDVEEFNREAKEIFENEVIPQIKNAMKKQTAVEWLIEQLTAIRKQNSGYRNIGIEYKELIEKAKQMEKEQIKRAFIASKMTIKTEEEYYNETFKK